MKNLFSLVSASFFSSLIFSQTSAQEWYDQGLKLRTDKKIPEAINAFKEATKLKSDFKEAFYEMGWCYNDRKEYTSAIASLRTARSLGLDYAKMFFELGFSHAAI